MPRKSLRLPAAPRLSLGLRISMYYAWHLFLSIIPHLLLFAVGYCLMLTPAIYDESRSAFDAAIGDMTSYQGERITWAVRDEEGRFLRGNAPRDLPGGKVYLYRDGSDNLYLKYEKDAPKTDTVDAEQIAPKQRVTLLIDITDEVRLLNNLLILLGVLELLRVIDFMRSGRNVSRKLFKPIDDIAQTAQNLSASNLSERINVEGTNNELKDLASVINEMLDRIEDAYISQKQFVSDASHELRTPISVIQGYAEMMDRWGKSEPEIRDEAIAAILSEAQGMKELVEKLLFIARHDKNTLNLQPEYFDASELVEEIAKETALIAGDHDIQVDVLESVILEGDRGTIKQALRTFIDNALKYTPAGGVIKLSCAAQGKYCRMTVSDTGVGIPPADLPRIFDRFYRADEARSGETEGHGLGLSIARIIVASHSGKIEVQSKLGKGSRFHILLPT